MNASPPMNATAGRSGRSAHRQIMSLIRLAEVAVVSLGISLRTHLGTILRILVISGRGCS
jgi:hypothetical protein